MTNLIQSFFMIIPGFRLEYIALLPAVALLLVGLFIETKYTSRLTFFLNSVTLISYFGIKENVKIWIGIISIVFFTLATWSFLSYITDGRISKIKWFEELVQQNRWILRIGGSLIIGIILLMEGL